MSQQSYYKTSAQDGKTVIVIDDDEITEETTHTTSISSTTETGTSDDMQSPAGFSLTSAHLATAQDMAEVPMNEGETYQERKLRQYMTYEYPYNELHPRPALGAALKGIQKEKEALERGVSLPNPDGMIGRLAVFSPGEIQCVRLGRYDQLQPKQLRALCRLRGLNSNQATRTRLEDRLVGWESGEGMRQATDLILTGTLVAPTIPAQLEPAAISRKQFEPLHRMSKRKVNLDESEMPGAKRLRPTSHGSVPSSSASASAAGRTPVSAAGKALAGALGSFLEMVEMRRRGKEAALMVSAEGAS